MLKLEYYLRTVEQNLCVLIIRQSNGEPWSECTRMLVGMCCWEKEGNFMVLKKGNVAWWVNRFHVEKESMESETLLYSIVCPVYMLFQ